MGCCEEREFTENLRLEESELTVQADGTIVIDGKTHASCASVCSDRLYKRRIVRCEPPMRERERDYDWVIHCTSLHEDCGDWPPGR